MRIILYFTWDGLYKTKAMAASARRCAWNTCVWILFAGRKKL
jgi:hypothetical protein